MLSPVVDQIAEENADIKVCKINVDEEMELAQKYGIMSIPTLLVFKNGQLANQSVGVIPKDAILNLVK
jgi:thioredoxin 1